MGRESSKECSVFFSWRKENFSPKKLYFEEFNLVFFTAEHMVCSKCNQGREVFAEFPDFQVHFAPYGQENYVFEREIMYVYSFMDVLYIFFSSALKKNYKMRSDLNFAMCSSADFTCVNGSTIQIVLRELL